MPNLWTQTSQKIYEAFYGPRTKDTEFDTKVEELKACERNLQGVKLIFTNFGRNTQGLKAYCKDVYTNVGLAYSESSPYWPLIVEMSQVHQEIERLYDSMVEVVSMISTQTVEWDRNFADVRKNVAIREEFRRTYDHYDEKLEKLVKVRNDKGMRNIAETPKEMESFDRNDAKYKKATDEFLKQSNYTYNIMCELLDFRYKLINPAITTFVNEERKFYTAVSDLFKRYENLQGKFQNLERQAKKEVVNNYDPRKYVRGYKLLNGVNVNELPDVKMNQEAKDKYSYEDYLKSKQNVDKRSSSSILQDNRQEVINSNNNLNNDNINSSNNKYSYEQYLRSKGTGNVSNTGNLNNSLSNSSSNFNQINSPNFGNIPNTYSKDFNDGLNFDINLNKPDQLRKTTIVAQPDYSTVTEQQVDHSDNPYSLLSFSNFNPQQNRSMTMNTNVNNRPQMGFSTVQPNTHMGNFSQMQGNNYNINRGTTGTSSSIPSLNPNPNMNPNFNSSFTNQNFNSTSNPNVNSSSFPRNTGNTGSMNNQMNQSTGNFPTGSVNPSSTPNSNSTLKFPR